MINKNIWKRQEEREISVVDLINKILRSWKIIVCFALIGAIIFAGYKYYKDLRNAAKLEQPISAEVPSLTPKEKEGVEYVRSLQNILDEQNTYMEESVLLRIDPYQENRTVLHYEIRGVSGDDALGLLEQYISYIRNGGIISDILTISKLGIPAPHLQEMIRANESATAYDIFNDRASRYFTVYVIGENIENANEMADALETALKSHSEILLTVPGQELILLSRQNSVVYDMELEQKRNALMSNWNAQTNTINALVSQFSEEQAAEYEGNDKNLTSAEQKQEIPTVNLDIKYVVVGLIIGLFLGSCWIIFCYLLSNRIKNAAEVRRNYNLCVYGGLKKKVKNEIKNQQEKNQILTQMILHCHKNNLKRLIFVSEHKIDLSSDQNILLIKELEEQGIQSMILENMLEQIEPYEKMGSTDAVVILAEAEKTAYPAFDNMLTFLGENNISLAGVIVVE